MRLCNRGAWASLAAVWSCAPTTHLAACYPVCCHPRPSPWAARPPAQNRKGKEVISIGSGSPEKLPSSEWAGGIPGAGDQIKAGPALACLPGVVSLIQQNTCSAVATLQAAGELWGAPGPAPGCPRPGRRGGRPRVRAGTCPRPPSYPPSRCGLCPRPGEQPLLVPPSARLSSLLFKAASRGAPRHLARGQRFADGGTAPEGTPSPPEPPTRCGAWVCLPSRDPSVPVSPDPSKPTLGRAGLWAELGVYSPGAHLSLSTQELCYAGC